MLSPNVWDILVAEQPSSEEWHLALQYFDLKGYNYKQRFLMEVVNKQQPVCSSIVD
jgi:hypothetical protein